MTHVREDTPVVVIEKSGGLGAFLIGAMAGAAVALLFAPQTGEETRRQIRDRGRRLRDTAKDRLDTWQERVEEGYEEAKARVEEGFDSARRSLDAGRAAVHSARDELERRLAESRRAREAAPAAEDDETT